MKAPWPDWWPEALAGIRTVQTFGHHELHDQRFAAANQQTLGAGLRLVELRARFTPLVQMCAALGTGAMLWVGAWGVLHGAWTVGLLLVALTYLRNMFRPVRSLSPWVAGAPSICTCWTSVRGTCHGHRRIAAGLVRAR